MNYMTQLSVYGMFKGRVVRKVGDVAGERAPPCQDSCRLELKNFRGPETTKMNTYSPERKAALIARM
ncbi:hypothetical protein, partial [Serratia ficaria]|uniref:hypothetical protein n=1 Tax=Serratia ficaria TaxID=61651 RepID=UPI0021C7893B